MGASARIKKIFSMDDRRVLVHVCTNSVEGKAYCRESEIGGYISDMMRFSVGSIQVTIDANPRS